LLTVVSATLVTLAGLTLAGISSGAPSAPAGGAPPPGSGSFRVESYIWAAQADTLDARLPGGRVAIAIIGIQGPRDVVCAREATAFVQKLVAEGAVLDEEPGLTFDSRSRRLYHVLTFDGRSVAEEAVGAGFARANGLGSNRDRLADLEAVARKAQRGCLWKGGVSP
jgi:endonuclease YncB( thermonuclease family)